MKIRFVEDVAIEETSFEDLRSKKPLLVKQKLIEHFETDSIDFFSIERESGGLSRPAKVIFFEQNECFSINLYPRNPPDCGPDCFDLSKYHKDRIEKLRNLERHFPPIIILETDSDTIILQEFVFAPVCDFSSQGAIDEFIDILYLASNAGIRLDINQNHWLFDEQAPRLYYVDKDFVGDITSFQKAVIANITQSTLYINLQNCQLFVNAFQNYSGGGDNERAFFNQAIQTLQDLVQNTQTKALSSKAQEKIKYFKLLIKTLTG